MLRKDVKEIKEKIDKLSTTIVNKATKYDATMDMINDMKFRVAKAYTYWDESRLAYVVKVEYKMPTVTLVVDEEGNTMLNERFRAINSLNMVPMEDLDQVASQIVKACKLNTEEVK